METFESVQSKASNIVGENTHTYTLQMFSEDYPIFFKKETQTIQGVETVVTVPLIPERIINRFIGMAKDAIQEERWGTKWEFATGLYIAHYCKLYSNTFQPLSENNNLRKAASAGSVIGSVASASVGDQSISYDNGAITQGTNQWGAWNSTTYGQQLITEAKLLGKGGAFII